MWRQQQRDIVINHTAAGDAAAACSRAQSCPVTMHCGEGLLSRWSTVLKISQTEESCVFSSAITLTTSSRLCLLLRASARDRRTVSCADTTATTTTPTRPDHYTDSIFPYSLSLSLSLHWHWHCHRHWLTDWLLLSFLFTLYSFSWPQRQLCTVVRRSTPPKLSSLFSVVLARAQVHHHHQVRLSARIQFSQCPWSEQ